MGFLKQRPAPVPIQERVPKRLNSWKEVAVYLNTSVRTVQRWEQGEQLPVRRHEHAGGWTVYAHTKELDEWLAARGKPLDGCPEPKINVWPPWLRWWLYGAGALAVVALAFWMLPIGRRPAPVESLAVLPFVNEGSDANTEYLIEGLPESITRRLSRLEGIHVRVIAHAAVARMKGRVLDAQEAGRLLNVEAVLTGRVTQKGQDLIVSVELVDIRDNTQIWGERFDRKLADVLTLQDHIAQEIAARLRLRLSRPPRPNPERSPTANPEAHRNYLRGRYHWNRRTEGGLTQAIEYFQRAIADDPAYALAYAGLAESYAMRSYYVPAPPAECASKAIAAARKALELDETLSEAWNALAQVEGDYSWEWGLARQHFRRALELNDGNADAHHWYSEYLAAVAQFEEEEKELIRAADLDPLSPIITNNQGHVYYFSRRLDPAAEKFRKAISEYPQFANAHKDLGKAYLAKGLYAEAVAELKRAQELGGAHIDAGLLGMAYGLSGDRASARALQENLLARGRREYVSPYTLAFVPLGLGETAEALGWLEKAIEERSLPLKWIGVDPLFDSLRAEPRFQALLKRMGLPGAPAKGGQ